MAKGDGSIISRGKGIWEVQVSFGKNPVTGKYERATKTVHGTKRDAAKERDRMRKEHENGLSVDAGKVTFGEFAESWHKARVQSGDLARRSLDGGLYHANEMAKHIGNLRLSAITPQVVESLYATIKAEHSEACGHELAGRTMLQYHVYLKQIMRKAVDYDLIVRNPCDRVKRPKVGKVERRSLSKKEAVRLLKCIDDSEAKAVAEFGAKERRQECWGVAKGRTILIGVKQISGLVAVRIGLATGMRVGEVLGLTWGNVDLYQPCIHVEQAFTNYDDTKDAKSDAGNRTIYIDEATRDHLANWRALQTDVYRKLGVIGESDALPVSAPVVCSNSCGYFNISNFEAWWRQWRTENGFPDLKFHELRHTQATQLLANGVDIKTAQTRLGHADPSTLLNWYAHALPENDKKAAVLIGSLFGGEDDEDAPKTARIIKLKTA